MSNIWTTDSYIYQATLSGVHVYDNQTEQMLWLVGYAAGVNSVWADDTYLYMGTTNSGVYRCSVSTVSGVQDTHQYLSEPDITDNVINYIHGDDKYLCVSTVSGVDHINMDTSARSHTDLDYGSGKCFQTSSGRFYYLESGYTTSDWPYKRKIVTSQPTIKNDIVYVELPYNPFDIQGYGPPASGVGNPYETYLDLSTNTLYRKDVPTYGATLFTNDASCSAAENSSDAHKALPPNTDSWGDWNTPDSSWYYDFGPGSGTAICRIDIKPGSLTSIGYGYSETQVAGSNDGVGYTVLHEQATEPAKTLHSVEFENSTSYRYYRLRSLSVVNILIMELYAYDAVFDWREAQVPTGSKIFPKGESIVHGDLVYPHYSDNTEGNPNYLIDNNLTTYCQDMTYVAVDFGVGNEKIINFIKICVMDSAANARITADNPTIEGSNNSTDGDDGTWDVLATIGNHEWKSPNKYPGYCALYIPVTTDVYTSLITPAGIATSGQGNASLVFDGSNTTYINTGYSPNNWIQYEFEEPQVVTRVSIRIYGSDSNYRAQGATFLASNTGQFAGEEVAIGVAYQAAGILDTFLNRNFDEYNATAYKFIRAIIWPNSTTNIAEIIYYKTTRTFSETPYRWYRLNGFTYTTDLRLSQWELYEGTAIDIFDYNKVNSDGSDIRFREIPENTAAIYWAGIEPLDTMTEIPHEIDYWTTSGTSFIKTLPPEGTTEFYMYYGNPAAFSEASPESFTVGYDFSVQTDLTAFNRSPDSGNYIELKSTALKIVNDNSAWDSGIMTNELMLDRGAVIPSVSGTNPTFSYKVYITQSANPYVGLYTTNDVYDRTTRDFELRFSKSSGDPEAYGFFQTANIDYASGKISAYPFEFFTWYEIKTEIIKSGTINYYRKVGETNWTIIDYSFSWRSNNRILYPGVAYYYSDKLMYIDDISIDLSYFDTSVILPEEVFDPVTLGAKFITIYNNTSDWTTSTVGHSYIPGDGLIPSNILFNDISIMEDPSQYTDDDNLILLASTGGLIVIEERQNDEENSRFMYYLLE